MSGNKHLDQNKHERIVYCVYDTLLDCAGKEKAISAQKLSAIYGINERALRDIINEIRLSTDFEKVVGACTKGYFVCATDAEVLETNNSLRHHALSELQVYWANERKAGRNGQGKIICGDDGRPFIESLAKAE